MSKKKKFGIPVIFGKKTRPRMVIYKSLKHLYVQLVNDEERKTMLAVSTLTPEIKKQLKSTHGVEAAKLVGTNIASAALKKDIEAVIFDRNGFRYHGKIKAIAEAAREAGLKF
jgi:large subunit ribosomal protein L18